MAFGTDVVTVGTSPVALHSVGITRITIHNLGFDSILIGTSGAGNQKWPLGGGSQINLELANTEVVYALAQKAGQKVAVVYSGS